MTFFVDNIAKIILDQEINYDRLANGLQLTRNRCQFNKHRNARIKEAQNCLSNGIYSLKEFLELFAKENDSKQYDIILQIGKHL